MQEKVVEILIYLVGELRKNTPLGEIDLTVLSKRGYTATEISTAFNWLFEKVSHGENLISNTAETSPHSHRVLHEAERSIISADAFGYVIQLRELGLITDQSIELLIDRIMMSGYVSVDVNEIKSLIATVILENDESINHGNRTMLNVKDTIN